MNEIKSLLPDYAKDIRLNLGIIASSTELDPRQAWGTAIASAVAARNTQLLRVLCDEATAHGHLSAAELESAKGAAAVMSMNNVYYRFTHLVGDDGYARLPARLRMHIIGKPGVPAIDFELWCLAVSAINGCGSCIASHERVLRDRGVSQGAIQDAVRIAAVVHAAAVIAETERETGQAAAAA